MTDIRQVPEQNPNYRHGHAPGKGNTASRTYHAWQDMKKRCMNPKHPHFDRYQHVSICTRWVLSFSNFLFDMGECPEGLTLERKDSTKGYERGNCVWADRATQRRSQSNTIMLSFRGETLCLQDMAEKHGLVPSCVRYRIDAGWSVERALTTPSRGR